MGDPVCRSDLAAYNEKSWKVRVEVEEHGVIDTMKKINQWKMDALSSFIGKLMCNMVL